MQPQSLIGQAAQSMNSGQPTLNQVGQQSPAFQPGLQSPPEHPMPEKSPASEIHKTPLHRAFERRGMTPPPQITAPQGAPQPAQPVQNGQQPVGEVERLIGALEKLGATFTKRLDMIGKHEEAIRDHVIPPKPKEPVSPM